MNVSKILNAVDALHAKAVRSGSLTINKIKYLFNFNGSNYIVTRADGKDVSISEGAQMELNTREIKVAKKWLREWFEN